MKTEKMENYAQIFIGNGYVHNEEEKTFSKDFNIKTGEVVINGIRNEQLTKLSIVYNYDDDLKCVFIERDSEGNEISRDDEFMVGFRVYLMNGNNSEEIEMVYSTVNDLYKAIIETENKILR